jgi:hypothetical protein
VNVEWLAVLAWLWSDGGITSNDDWETPVT